MISRKKRGVSEMVAYVMLIVIAISLSLLVYAWLKTYALKPQEKCDQDISLIVESYSCNQGSKEVNVTFKNMGKFNIDGVFLRVSNSSSRKPIYTLTEKGQVDLSGRVYFGPALRVDETRSYTFSYLKHGNIESFGIEPFQVKDNKVIFCEDAVVTQAGRCG